MGNLKKIGCLLSGFLLVSFGGITALANDSTSSSEVTVESSLVQASTDGNDKVEETKEETTQDKSSDTTSSNDYYSESYKQEQLRLLEIYYINGYLSEEEYNQVKSEMTLATSYDEIAQVWDKLFSNNNELNLFAIGFSEQYGGIKAKIEVMRQRDLLTQEQADELMAKLNAATTLEELDKVSNELKKYEQTIDSTSGTTESSTETTSQSTKSTSSVTSDSKGKLPQTGESKNIMMVISGITLMISSLFVFKRQA